MLNFLRGTRPILCGETQTTHLTPRSFLESMSLTLKAVHRRNPEALKNSNPLRRQRPAEEPTQSVCSHYNQEPQPDRRPRRPEERYEHSLRNEHQTRDDSRALREEHCRAWSRRRPLAYGAHIEREQRGEQCDGGYVVEVPSPYRTPASAEGCDDGQAPHEPS